MASTSVKQTKITDHQGKCRDCGALLSRSETIVEYWNYSEYNGSTGRTISEKGISSIDVNAGICMECQAKKLRKKLGNELKEAKENGNGAPGTVDVYLCGLGIFVSLLALLLKATRVDEYGLPVPFINVWFFIWLALGLISIIGLPFAIARKKRLCSEAISRIEEELNLDDSDLLSKYAVVDGVPYMKIVWDDYIVKNARGQGGLVYVSELMKMGSPEEIAKKLHLPQDLSSVLYMTALQYSS